MALGTTAAIMLGVGAFGAATQVGAGNAQAKSIKQQSEYEAQVSEQQAELVGRQKTVVDRRYDRLAGRTRATGIATTAGKGLMLSGSPLAIMADIESQIEFDRAGEQYNLDIQKGSFLSQAENTRATGRNQSRQAKSAGYMNAFSTMLSTGYSVSQMNTGNPLQKKSTVYRPTHKAGGRTYKSPYGNTYKY